MKYPITVQKVEKSRLGEVELTNLVFGKTFTDHCFIADYFDGAWQNCRIEPYGNLPMAPSIYTLHYGQGVFEGLKAVKNAAGDPLLFRPKDNWNRINYSGHRMALPIVPEEIFMNGLKQLITLDKNWIPEEEGSALYIRPFTYANEELIGIRPTEHFRFMIICSPVSKYYSTPVKIKVADKYVRAFHGGTGDAKAIGNYGATMQPMLEAKQEGFDQVLWMDGLHFNYVQEIGSMNVFFQIGHEFITPNLDGCILAGVTRDSVIKLLQKNGYSITERPIDIEEIVTAYNNGTLNDAFGTGTAASIAPIHSFGYKGQVLTVKPIEQRAISAAIKAELDGIKHGLLPDVFNWIMPA
jgi:branched-chain amino acid aminotransferase